MELLTATCAVFVTKCFEEFSQNRCCKSVCLFYDSLGVVCSSRQHYQKLVFLLFQTLLHVVVIFMFFFILHH